MDLLLDTVKTTSEIAIPRAYIIACACEIEKTSQDIIYKMVRKDKCPYIYEFLNKKQVLGELNFKWKNPAFEKFLKLFGDEFYNNVKIKIIAEGIDMARVNSAFETIGANRGSVAHENSFISVTLTEIEENFQICMKVFDTTNQYIDQM
jgi:hypothetical protein